MSSNKISTRQTHSHDARKPYQSTNVINHVTNTISSDRTLTQVNDGQTRKKRVEGGSNKRTRSEVVVAPVTHKAMVSSRLLSVSASYNQ